MSVFDIELILIFHFIFFEDLIQKFNTKNTKKYKDFISNLNFKLI